jgi:hypothetical protein
MCVCVYAFIHTHAHVEPPLERSMNGSTRFLLKQDSCSRIKTQPKKRGS